VTFRRCIFDFPAINRLLPTMVCTVPRFLSLAIAFLALGIASSQTHHFYSGLTIVVFIRLAMQFFRRPYAFGFFTIIEISTWLCRVWVIVFSLACIESGKRFTERNALLCMLVVSVITTISVYVKVKWTSTELRQRWENEVGDIPSEEVQRLATIFADSGICNDSVIGAIDSGIERDPDCETIALKLYFMLFNHLEIADEG
jgi:hypothetical protein